MKNTSNNNTKLILLQPSLHKNNVYSIQPSRIFLIFVISFFTFASLFSLLTSNPKPSSPETRFAQNTLTTLPLPIYDSILHYATSSAAAGRMSDSDIRFIASVLRRRSPANLLIFGLGAETLLWKTINYGGGRTVILDENEYYIKHFEDKHPGIEAYDVSYSTKVSEYKELIADAKEKVRGDCKPVQNLLFSECRLAINDLPNELYEVEWDVIIVDGPRGYSEKAPGRMSAIFTAAVMARKARGKTDVIVHDFERDVERMYSQEFLCGENLVKSEGQIGHFVVHGGGGGGREFCANKSVGLPPVSSNGKL